MILTSSLDLTHSLVEIQVKRTIEKKEYTNEIKKLYGRFIKVKAQITSSELLNRADAWKVGFSYPLVACCNTERADELIVASMVNGLHDQVLMKLNFGTFVSFVQSNN